MTWLIMVYRGLLAYQAFLFIISTQTSFMLHSVNEKDRGFFCRIPGSSLRETLYNSTQNGHGRSIYKDGPEK